MMYLSYLSTWLWNAAVLGGTAYYVFERGHSGWWFLLACLLLQGWKPEEK